MAGKVPICRPVAASRADFGKPVGECPVCFTRGRALASCDACWTVAYDRELARVICAEHEATVVYGPTCDAVSILRSIRDGLLAAHAGHGILRAIFPGARMQAPEAP